MMSSELLAEAVLRARSDAIVAADREGIIRFWNPGAERIFVMQQMKRSDVRSV
jgi:PAS domain-containing protein